MGIACFPNPLRPELLFASERFQGFSESLRAAAVRDAPIRFEKERAENMRSMVHAGPSRDEPRECSLRPFISADRSLDRRVRGDVSQGTHGPIFPLYLVCLSGARVRKFEGIVNVCEMGMLLDCLGHQ
jgi:hypothetical protein